MTESEQLLIFIVFAAFIFLMPFTIFVFSMFSKHTIPSKYDNISEGEKRIALMHQCGDCTHCVYNTFSIDCEVTRGMTHFGKQACYAFQKGGARRGYIRHL